MVSSPFQVNISKRKILNVSDKIKIFEDVDAGLRIKDVTAKYGIAPNSVSTIIKMRTSILKSADMFENDERKRETLKALKYEDMDKAVPLMNADDSRPKQASIRIAYSGESCGICAKSEL